MFTELRFVDLQGNPRYQHLPPSPAIPAGVANGQVAWSPDGRRLAIVSQNTNAPSSIWLIEPASVRPEFRRVVELPPGPRIRGLAWSPDGGSLIIGKHDTVSDIVLIELRPRGLELRCGADLGGGDEIAIQERRSQSTDQRVGLRGIPHWPRPAGLADTSGLGGADSLLSAHTSDCRPSIGSWPVRDPPGAVPRSGRPSEHSRRRRTCRTSSSSRSAAWLLASSPGRRLALAQRTRMSWHGGKLSQLHTEKSTPNPCRPDLRSRWTPSPRLSDPQGMNHAGGCMPAMQPGSGDRAGSARKPIIIACAQGEAR